MSDPSPAKANTALLSAHLTSEWDAWRGLTTLDSNRAAEHTRAVIAAALAPWLAFLACRKRPGAAKSSVGDAGAGEMEIFRDARGAISDDPANPLVQERVRHLQTATEIERYRRTRLRPMVRSWGKCSRTSGTSPSRSPTGSHAHDAA